MSVLRILPLIGLLLIGFSNLAVAAQPLITPDWILSNVGKPGLVGLLRMRLWATPNHVCMTDPWQNGQLTQKTR